MDQLSLPKTSFFLHSNLGFGFGEDFVKTYKGSNGAKVYSGVPVFRTGTFADSMGDVTTWEPLHLSSMITNCNYLSSNHIMDGWQVRDGHSTWMVGGVQGRGNVVGWTLKDMETKTLKSPVDGQEYDYLLVDYTLTEAYAEQKLSSGTWRHRSSEIGTYKTNNAVELGPTFMGFAFVDMPAVEGLNFSSSNGSKIYVDLGGAYFNKETQMPEGTQQQQGVALPLPFLPVTAVTPPATQQHAAPVVPAAQTQPTFTFTCNGAPMADPTRVQTYINQLEAVITEAHDVSRKSFVAELVRGNKILAAQAAHYEKFALSLDDEQYVTWCTQTSGGPVLGQLGQHGTGQAQLTGTQSPTSPAAPANQALQDAKDRVKMHRKMGMPQVALEKTDSWKAVIAAGATA
jgi:hypothetical protein